MHACMYVLCVTKLREAITVDRLVSTWTQSWYQHLHAFAAPYSLGSRDKSDRFGIRDVWGS